MKRLPMIFLLLALPMVAMQAHAALWLCSTGKGAERDGNAPRAISRNDIIQAYSGQPVLLGGAWLLAYMLPVDSADTKAAFMELGISPAAAQAMTKNSLVDRGIRLAKTPEELLERLSQNPPAVGYSYFFLGDKNVETCF